MSQDNQYIRIQTTGRKTGNVHRVLVRFITLGQNKIIAFPFRTGRQDWVLNVSKNPQVELFTPSGGHYWGTCEVKKITGLKDPILAIFERKYGKETINRWYFGQTFYVELEVSRLGSVDLDQIIYDDLETAFDGVAEDYDRHIFGNPINTWLRDVSIGVMSRIFKPNSTVLEIGCGTGTETLSLAKQGVNMIASDISSKMLDVLMKKARKEGLEDKVIPIHCRPPELVEKIHDEGYDRIDGAYSTYGAINTEPNLPKLITNLRSLLKEGSPFLVGVWNKYCAYEILGYLVKLRRDMAFARLLNPVPIGKSRFCVATNAFSVSSIDKLLKPYFERKSVYGVVISLPPSNLTRYLPRRMVLKKAMKFDLALGRVYPFNRLGDHFLALYMLNKGI